MECPIEIVDPSKNLENHRFAIAKAMLGPADPSQANTAFWGELANRWEVGMPDALARRCSNCEHYIDTQKVQECIKRHGKFDITMLGPGFKDMNDASGYCTLYHITCTASRVCVDWEVGGPITTTKEGEQAMQEREDAKKMSAKQKKVRKVMHEFKSGTLKSSSGQPVKSRQQAIAIAMSEAGMSRGTKSDAYWDAYVLQIEQEDPEDPETETDASCGTTKK